MQILFILALIGAAFIAGYYLFKWYWMSRVKATRSSHDVWLDRAKEDCDAMIQDIRRTKNFHELSEYSREVSTYYLCYLPYLRHDTIQPLADRIGDAIAKRRAEITKTPMSKS